ncbi:MAG: hypothetical protein KZQ76_12820 [Candidatus Thiodiazotropha sp. (ex Epidulcina cf. delphinae)]|nr:hypothetical protein [Candidatus Thiodiazotropha sp. (ex Epidulcina cf. delphinae)]
MSRTQANRLLYRHSREVARFACSILPFIRHQEKPGAALITTTFLIFFLLPINCSANSHVSNILILLSGNEDVYLDVATTITNSTIKYCRNHGQVCQNANFEIVQVASYDIQREKDYFLIVTLGIKAAEFAQHNLKDKIILSALLPQSNSRHEKLTATGLNHFFLYLDQPLHRSLLLIKVLSDRFKSVGVLISKDDTVIAHTLSEAAGRLDLDLDIQRVESKDQIGASLNNLLDDIDILLAVPDTNIHNRSTVSNILLSAYRKRIPLIGFSSAYVKAGALAGVYSSPEDIALQVRDSIVTLFSGRSMPKMEQTADYFSILFNADVARSLGFPVESVNKLKAKMLNRLNDDP